MTAIELFYWITGSAGVVLTAQGLSGLRLGANATKLWDLTDPLGRNDFHFSEGQFDLILDRLKRDTLLSVGALSLLVSLALSAAGEVVQSCYVVPTAFSWAAMVRIAALFVGCLAGILVRLAVNRASVEFSARAMETRASRWISTGQREEDSLRRELGNWFERRTKRKPRL